MKISEQTVIQVAKLAAIEISEQDIKEYTSDLSSVLEYIEIMNEVDVSLVEPTCHVHGINNALRDDVLLDSLNRDVALSSAPQTAGSSYKVPRIISSQ